MWFIERSSKNTRQQEGIGRGGGVLENETDVLTKCWFLQVINYCTATSCAKVGQLIWVNTHEIREVKD